MLQLNILNTKCLSHHFLETGIVWMSLFLYMYLSIFTDVCFGFVQWTKLADLCHVSVCCIQPAGTEGQQKFLTYYCVFFVSADIREEMDFDYTVTNELLSAMYVFQEAVSNCLSLLP